LTGEGSTKFIVLDSGPESNSEYSGGNQVVEKTPETVPEKLDVVKTETLETENSFIEGKLENDAVEVAKEEEEPIRIRPDLRDYILVIYPELKLKYQGDLLFKCHLTTHDIIYLCENGVERFVIDFVRNYYAKNLEGMPKNLQHALDTPKGESTKLEDHEEYQETYIMLKPDAIPRKKVGQILSSFTRVGLRVLHMEMATPSADLVQEHYAEHKGKHFYDGLCEFVLSGPVIKLLVGGI
jgi:hypothetical protein